MPPIPPFDSCSMTKLPHSSPTARQFEIGPTVSKLLLLALAMLSWPPASVVVSVCAAEAGNPVAALASTPNTQILARGQDFAFVQNVVPLTDVDGTTTFRTNQFTLLENAVHYFENQQWKPSENFVEAFPDGAVARRGPIKPSSVPTSIPRRFSTSKPPTANGCAAACARFNWPIWPRGKP